MTAEKTKILILRLSSIGDIIQALSVVEPLKEKFPASEIHWVVRSDFQDLVKFNPHIDKVHVVDRQAGFKGLRALTKTLQKEKFSHVYDAHNNLRSHFISFFLHPQHFLRRSKDRFKRFLLFNLRMNMYQRGLTAFETYTHPLIKWGIDCKSLKNSQLCFPEEIKAKVLKKIPYKDYVALIPAAAWELKRWPIDYWRKLIESMPHENFVILGGKSDVDLDDIMLPEFKNRLVSLRGELSILESCAVVAASKMAVGCDTGLSHAADQMGIPIVFLTGPTAFGLPIRESSYAMAVDLPCRPCTKDGRGKCRNPVYKKCLYDIHPNMVKSQIEHHHA